MLTAAEQEAQQRRKNRDLQKQRDHHNERMRNPRLPVMGIEGGPPRAPDAVSTNMNAPVKKASHARKAAAKKK